MSTVRCVVAKKGGSVGSVRVSSSSKKSKKVLLCLIESVLYMEVGLMQELSPRATRRESVSNNLDL